MSGSMPTWSALSESYLAYRRSLGYSVDTAASYLPQFARFAEARGAKRLTVQLAIEWAGTCKSQAQLTRARRLQCLRGFAKYCLKFDPTGEVPPTGLFGSAKGQRRVPHIYTERELRELQDATAILLPRGGLRPLTYRALFGLLAASGLRAAEVLGLKRADVDLKEGILSVRDSKRHKSRFVPLHQSVARALNEYARQRDRHVPDPQSDRFFLMDNGKPPRGPRLDWTLRRLAKTLRWKVRGDYPQHRVRDFRHTFIVRSILQTFKAGQEFDRVALALSRYVGHDHVADTYWYLTGIPELMAVAGERFHPCAEVLP